MLLMDIDEEKRLKLIEALEAALSTCGEWGLTTEQEELLKEHIEELKDARQRP